MGAPQYEQAGADVAGTGTANYVAKWTGGSTLGNSIIQDNGATITFGGNLASSAAQTWTLTSSTSALNIGSGLLTLDTVNNRVVAGSVSATQTTLRVSSIGTANNSPASSLYRNGVAEFAQYVSSAGALAFAANPAGFTDAQLDAAAKVWLTSGGNVGIATALPKDLLHVAGGSLKVGADAINSFLSFGDESVTARNNGIYRPASSNTLALGSYNLITFNVSATSLGSQTERMRIDSSGNVYAASGTTGMTNGFFYIPGAAGAPTGTPTAVTGRVPMYYDTTNNKFYVYNGAWKQVTLT